MSFEDLKAMCKKMEPVDLMIAQIKDLDWRFFYQQKLQRWAEGSDPMYQNEKYFQDIVTSVTNKLKEQEDEITDDATEVQGVG